MIHKFLVTTAAIVGCGSILLFAQRAVYTDEQASSGKAVYQKMCAKCHTDTLAGMDSDVEEVPPAVRAMGGKVPPLVGSKFMTKWGERTTKDLYQRIQMVEKMEEEKYLGLVAYVMQYNGAQAGAEALTTSTAVPIKSIATGVK